jgi:hypothetical protein
LAASTEALTLDKTYNINTNEAQRIKGFMSSAAIAGGQVGRGIKSGVKNLVILPLRGAKNGGFKGAMKGFGRGVVGLVVKPVAGIARGIATVSQGAQISMDRLKHQDNTGIAGKLSKTLLRERKRLPRHFGSKEGILLPYDATLSLAHELLLRTAWHSEELDQAFVVVGGGEEVQHLVLLTDRTVLMIEVFASKDGKPEVLWSVNIANVRHVATTVQDEQKDGVSRKTLSIVKRSKIVKAQLEKQGKMNKLWRWRSVVVEDNHLSWSNKKKKLGKMLLVVECWFLHLVSWVEFLLNVRFRLILFDSD